MAVNSKPSRSSPKIATVVWIGYGPFYVAESLDLVYTMMPDHERADFDEARSILGPIKAISGAGEPPWNTT